MVRIRDCRLVTERSDHISAAAAAIRRGTVVVAPDEGMYALVCDAFSAPAVAQIRELKGRANSPLAVLVGAHGTVAGISSQIPTYATDLMQAFWPGPLTLILRQQPSLAWPLHAPGVAVRMPLHPVLLSLVREVGPTAVTAANAAGYPTNQELSTALEQLDDRPGVALDVGDIAVAERSTVIDATGEIPVIMRTGAFGTDRIEAVCPDFEVRPG